MSSVVPPFRNRDNFLRFLLLHYEPGASVLLTVFLWLYKDGQDTPENFLVTLADVKSNGLNKSEEETLRKLKNGVIALNQLDFSLLFSVTKLACNVAPRSDQVWSKNCPPHRQQELEHLFSILKAGRNDLAHPSDAQKNLTDFDVESKAREMEQLLSSILTLAGNRAGIDTLSINQKIKAIKENIERICEGDSDDSKLKPYIHELIKDDLRSTYESDLRNTFENELKSYVKPTLIFHTDDGEEENQPVRHLLHYFGQEKILALVGSSGDGKTSLAKHLFYSWISEAVDNFQNLSSYDVVFMIQCRSVKTKSISEYLETELTTSVNYFTNTSSLRRQIKASKVLWILDGYDERTSDAKGLLQEIVATLSQSHDLLITLRESYLNILREEDKIDIHNYVTIGPFTDTDTEELLTKLISDLDKVRGLKTKYQQMISSSSEKLNNPLTLKLFVNAYIDNCGNDTTPISITKLYNLDAQYKLDSLAQRTEPKSHLSKGDLKSKIESWFEVLCSEAYHLILKQTLGYIGKDSELKLQRQANQDYLIPLECISAFFPTTELKGLGRSFTHLTQQYYFAALYLMKALKGETLHTEDRNCLLPTSFLGSQGIHYKETIKFWIRIEAENNTLDSSIKFLAQALFYISDPWYFEDLSEFLAAAENNENLTETIACNVKLDAWNCYMETCATTVKLLEYATPDYIIFRVEDKSGRKPLALYDNFKSIVETVKNRERIVVECHLFHNNHLKIGSKEYSDKFVTEFSNKKLKLKRFTGTLDDCKLLSNCYKELQYVKLRLTNKDTFIDFLYVQKIYKFDAVANMYLILDFELQSPLEKTVHFNRELRRCTQLYLPHVNKDTSLIYTDLLKSLSTSIMEKLPECMLAKAVFRRIIIRRNNLSETDEKKIKLGFGEKVNISFVLGEGEVASLQDLPGILNELCEDKQHRSLSFIVIISFLICILARIMVMICYSN